MKIQYITNEAGEQKAVIVPMNDWERLNEEKAALQEKLDVLMGIKDALDEVTEIRQGKRKKGRTLSAFLDEC